MLWHNLFLSYIPLYPSPHHTRSGISLLQSDLRGFLAVMLKLAGDSVFSGIPAVPVCTACLRVASGVHCQNRFLSKVPFNNKYMELWILTGPGLKYGFVDVHEMELQSRKIKMIAL